MSWYIILCLVFLGLLVLCIPGYIFLRKYLEWKTLPDLEQKDRISLKIDLFKAVAQVLGGLILVVGFIFTWQNIIVAKEKQNTELYVKAVEQLGNKDIMMVRVGGIYALERIARDSEKDYWPIMELLTAFVRDRVSLKESRPAFVRDRVSLKESRSQEMKSP